MKSRTPDPDFGATGQFDMTGVFQLNSLQEGEFSHTLGIENVKNMVLVGAGLAHRQVLQQLARHKRKDIDVVLITPHSKFVHPSLLVNWVAGHLSLEQCQSDLRPWIADAGIRWIPAACSFIDSKAKKVALTMPNAEVHTATLEGELPPIPYDVLSLDDECAHHDKHIEHLWPGASTYALTPQLSSKFVQNWTARINKLAQESMDIIQQVCVLGAHRQAIEWALAVQHGLHKANVTAQVTLVTAGERLGRDLPPSLQKRLQEIVVRRGIKVKEDTCVGIEADTLTLGRGTDLPCDLALICQGLSGHHSVLNSTLLHDAQGRVRINEKLQSLSDPHIFASGDLSCLEDGQRMPSTWESENLGQILSLNLMAYLSEQPLSTGQYRSTGPITVNCGDQTALIQWGPICTESHLAWKMHQKQQQSLLSLKKA